MHVSRGWSGEFASGQWGKCSVGAGEEDLKRLLQEYDCDIPVERIPYRRVWRLLDLMVEELLVLEQAGRFNYPSERAQERTTTARAQIKEVIKNIIVDDSMKPHGE